MIGKVVLLGGAIPKRGGLHHAVVYERKLASVSGPALHRLFEPVRWKNSSKVAPYSAALPTNCPQIHRPRKCFYKPPHSVNRLSSRHSTPAPIEERIRR